MKKIVLNQKTIWTGLIFFLFFGSISLGQLARISNTSATIYPHDLIAVLLSIMWLKQKTIPFKNIYYGAKNNPLFTLLFTWVTLGWVLALVRNELGITALALAARVCIYTLSVMQLYSQVSRYLSPQFWKVAIFFTSFLMSIWGIIQYLVVPDTRFLHIFGWDDHYYRLIGPVFDPNYAGMIAVIGLWTWQEITTLLSTHTLFIKYKLGITTFVHLTLLTALTMTFSRSSWLAVLASLIISFIFTDSKKGLRRSLARAFFWITAMIVCYLLLPKPTGEGVDLARTASVTARTSLSQQLVHSWSWHEWIVGRGLFNVRPDIDNLAIARLEGIPNTSRQPDNIFVQIIGSLGVGGSLILLLLLIKSYKSIPLSTQELPLLVAWLTHAQFNNSLFQPHLWILLVSYVVANKHHSLKLSNES